MTHPSLVFLDTLDPRTDATFNIETFTDLPKGGAKPNPDPLCRRYPNQTLLEVAELIPALKAANEGGGAVYVAVNQCDGQRNKANIVRVRGVHADMDGVSEEILASIREKLKPTLEVQSSSPTNFHFYWLLKEGEELDIATAEAINCRLVELGADKAAIDVSRLLRLPGFRHMKYRDGGLND